MTFPSVSGTRLPDSVSTIRGGSRKPLFLSGSSAPVPLHAAFRFFNQYPVVMPLATPNLFEPVHLNVISFHIQGALCMFREDVIHFSVFHHIAFINQSDAVTKMFDFFHVMTGIQNRRSLFF